MDTTDRRPLILVVDDDRGVLSAVRGLLRYGGYRVVTAPDGAAALDLVIDRGGDLSLVLSDIDMPRMNGLELRAALSGLLPELPVILMSGAVGRPDLPGLLHKPFRSAHLLARVSAAIAGEDSEASDAARQLG